MDHPVLVHVMWVNCSKSATNATKNDASLRQPRTDRIIEWGGRGWEWVVAGEGAEPTTPRCHATYLPCKLRTQLANTTDYKCYYSERSQWWKFCEQFTEVVAEWRWAQRRVSRQALFSTSPKVTSSTVYNFYMTSLYQQNTVVIILI